MKITNKLNLPQPLVDAVLFKPYSKGKSDYSITQLLKPPRATALEKAHWESLEQDVSEMIWLLIGICVHEILDRAEKEALPRDRLFTEFAGKIVSGANDRFVVKGGVLQDYKVTSSWKVKKGMDLDWAAQLNGYVYLLAQLGHEVKKAEIVAICRDWNRKEAEKSFTMGTGYPPLQIAVIEGPIWPLEQTKAFFEERVRLHEAALSELPLCSDDERWATPDTFAVYKDGNTSRAAKVLDSEEMAKRWIDDFGKEGANYEIVKRHGESKRCGYCLARQVCTQYKDMQK